MHGSTDKEKQKRGGGRRRTEATERGLVHVHTRRIELSYKFFSTVVRRDDINQSLSRNSLLLVVDLKKDRSRRIEKKREKREPGKGSKNIRRKKSREKRDGEKKKCKKKKKVSCLPSILIANDES